MKKAWWPTRAYEARPWLAIALGLACAAFAFHDSVRAHGDWKSGGTIAFMLGCGLVVYGAVVLQIRRDYRKRSKWHRENS